MSRRCFSSSAAQDDDTTDSTHTIPFLLADIGEGIHEVELLQWYVQPGDVLQQFDLVAQVQSDKATVDISCRFDGVVTELGGQVGDMVQVGTPLLYLKVNGENGVSENQQLWQEEGKDRDIPPVTSSIDVSDTQAMMSLLNLLLRQVKKLGMISLLRLFLLLELLRSFKLVQPFVACVMNTGLPILLFRF